MEPGTSGFDVLSAVAFAAWMFGVLEWLATVLMSRWAFAIGLPIARSEYSVGLPPDALMAPSKGETRDTKYAVIDNSTCIFRRKYAFFDTRFNTLLEIKGTMVWEAGVLRSTARTPVGILTFAALFLVVWTAGGINSVLRAENWTPLLIGWVAIGGMIGVSLIVERRRFTKYLTQVQKALGIEAQVDPL